MKRSCLKGNLTTIGKVDEIKSLLVYELDKSRGDI